MSRAWIDFGTNISRLEFTSDPSHYESVVRNVFSDIVLSPFNVSGMFSILVTGTHSNCNFAVKEIVMGDISSSEICSSTQSNILRWLAVMKLQVNNYANLIRELQDRLNLNQT